jgi:hypothetical protein
MGSADQPVACMAVQPLRGHQPAAVNGGGQFAKLLLLADMLCAAFMSCCRYEALKAERGQYDVMDLTHYVWRELREHGYTGPHMQVR